MSRISRYLIPVGAALLIAAVISHNGASAASDNTTIPAPTADQASSGSGEQTAVFSGGCFWGVQAVFQHVKGVTSATSGYTGGAAATAHYDIVSTGETGHAESVEIIY